MIFPNQYVLFPYYLCGNIKSWCTKSHQNLIFLNQQCRNSTYWCGNNTSQTTTTKYIPNNNNNLLPKNLVTNKSNRVQRETRENLRECHPDHCTPVSSTRTCMPQLTLTSLPNLVFVYLSLSLSQIYVRIYLINTDFVVLFCQI